MDEKMFMDFISTRHSTRTFKDKKLGDKIIEKILSAATKGSSAGNLQSYKIFVVTKPEQKKDLAGAAHDQSYVENCSAVFVFCADPQNAYTEYGKRGEELFCIQDATIACTFAQLEVHSLGLASVWVGSFEDESVSKILEIQNSLRPVAMLVVGYADEDPEITERKSITEVSQIL